MKLKNLFIGFYGFIIVSLLILGVLAFIISNNQEKLITGQEQHLRSYLLANDLKKSSEDLTRFCRNYVFTEDPLWEKKYWEVLDIRNGKIGKDGGKAYPLLDSLKKLGLTNDEFILLKEAEDFSNELVNTEKKAFYAVKGLFEDGSGNYTVKKQPDVKLASKILFDDKYYQAQRRIMEPIDKFISVVSTRTQAQIQKQKAIALWLLRVKIILVFLVIVIAVLSFFLLKERIIKKLLELNQAHTILEERDEQFRLFMDSLPGLAYIKDNDTRALFANKGFQTYLGIEESAILNKKAFDIFPPEFASKIEEDDIRVLGSDKTERIEEVFAGRTWATQKFIIPRTGKPPYLGGISIDITETKKAEETSRKFFYAVEQSAMSVVITDINGAIEYVNPKFTQLTGYTKEEVEGKNPRVLKSDNLPKEKYKELWETISSGKEWRGEFCNLKKNKELYWESATISPLFDNSGKITHYIAIKEDITEKKAIERALAESEEKYRISFTNSPDAYFIIIDGVYVDCNRSAERFLRLDRKDIIGRKTGSYSAGYLPDGRKASDVFNEELERARTEGNHNFIWKSTRDDGSEVIVDVTVTLIELEGKPAIFATWRDITEKKKAEVELKVNEAKLQEAQAIGHLGNWEINLNTGLIKGSDEAARIYGMEPGSEYPLNYVQSAVLPEYRAQMDKELKELIEGKRNYDQEFLIRRFNDGAYRWLHSKAEFVTNGAGTPPRIVGIVQDITERKLVAEELHKSRTFLSDIIENNGALIYVKDKFGVHQLVNKKWEETTGLTRDKVIGKSDIEIFPDGDAEKFRLVDMQTIMEGKIIECEEVLSTPSGNKHFLTIKFPMREGGEITGLCGISTEITERKEAESKLQKYTEELQDLNHTKDKFFSIIAHDLKNPFHGLINLSRMLLQDYMILTEDEKISFIKSIEDLSNNTYKLLENLLDWSRVQTGRMPLNIETFNLLSELYPTITILRQSAANKNITFNYTIEQSAVIRADKNMLSTIVRNIVTNAVKFTQQGGKISLNVKYLDDRIEFAVSDTGIGIDKEDLSNLFRIDKNIKTLGTAKEKGTGIGLLLCKELVEKHNGEIWAESETGKGTTFYFTIPVE